MSEHAGLSGTIASDAELIAAARAGDTQAFGTLYERHGDAARNVARQYSRTPADADDITADAFARVLAVLQSGGGPDEAFRAYLFTVVRRLAHAVAQGAQRVQVTDDVATFETAFGPAGSVEEPALEGFERTVVARAFDALPERWQAVLWYTEVEGLSAAQVAPLLGLSANGVAALTYRAREGLRQGYLQQHLQSAATEQCSALAEKLGSYVRGGLSARDTRAVDAHLDGCVECQQLVTELRDVNHGMRAVVAPLVLGVAALGGFAPWQLGFGGALAGTVGAAPQGAAAGGTGGAVGAPHGGPDGLSDDVAGASDDRGAAGALPGGGPTGAGVSGAGGIAGVVASAPVGTLVTAAAVLVGVLAVSVAAALGVFRTDPDPVTVAAPAVEADEEPGGGDVRAPRQRELERELGRPEPASDDLPAGPPGEGGSGDDDRGADDDSDAGDEDDDSDEGDDPDADDDAVDDDEGSDGDDADDGTEDDDPADRDDGPGDEDDGTGQDDDSGDDDSGSPDDGDDEVEDGAPTLGLSPDVAGPLSLVRGEADGTAADVEILNSGTGPATDLVATVTLPDQLVFAVDPAGGAAAGARTSAALASGTTSWACEPAGGLRTMMCRLTELPAGAGAPIPLRLVVDEAARETDDAAITIELAAAEAASTELALPVEIVSALGLRVVDQPVTLPPWDDWAAQEPEYQPSDDEALVAVATVLNRGSMPLEGVALELIVPGWGFSNDIAADGWNICGHFDPDDLDYDPDTQTMRCLVRPGGGVPAAAGGTPGELMFSGVFRLWDGVEIQDITVRVRTVTLDGNGNVIDLGPIAAEGTVTLVRG